MAQINYGPPAGAPPQPIPAVTQYQLQIDLAHVQTIYNFFATIINKNVNMFLLLKKFLINISLKLLSYISIFVVNNREFISKKIDIVAYMAKLVVLNMPYINLATVGVAAGQTSQSDFATPESEQLPWIYEIPTRLAKLLNAR